MKGRESGMPEEEFWSSFFDPEGALERLLGQSEVRGNLVEFGCGYGIFTIPAARRTTGILSALDIEPEMVARIQSKAEECRLNNIRAQLRDFVAVKEVILTNPQYKMFSDSLRYNIQTGAPLLLDSHAEPHRDGRHLPTARRTARPFLYENKLRLCG